MCEKAAAHLRERYLNVDELKIRTGTVCQSEDEFSAVWTLFERFTQIERWVEYVFEELEDMVRASSSQGRNLDPGAKRALYRIAIGRTAAKEVQEMVPDIIRWFRFRGPKKMRSH